MTKNAISSTTHIQELSATSCGGRGLGWGVAATDKAPLAISPHLAATEP
jgi:hypothetical protein